MTGGGSTPGSAYVLNNLAGVWTESTQLAAPAGLIASDSFGAKVALSADGTTALVAAPNHAVGAVTNAGTVYVFDNVGGVWTQVAAIDSPVPTAGAWNSKAAWGRARR